MEKISGRHLAIVAHSLELLIQLLPDLQKRIAGRLSDGIDGYNPLE
jgi:hypothetical protein